MVVEGPLSAPDDGGPGTPQMVADAPPPIVVEGPPESSVDPSIEPSLATATPLRVDDGVFEAVLHVCGWDPGSLTPHAQGRVNKAVKELRDVGATAEQVRASATRYRSKFPSAALTPSALSANWPALGEAPLPLACDLAAAVRGLRRDDGSQVVGQVRRPPRSEDQRPRRDRVGMGGLEFSATDPSHGGIVTVAEKADRLRSEARLQIKYCTEGLIQAAVRGDSGVHDVRWTSMQGWSCSCPALVRRCSHVETVASVTTRSVLRITQTPNQETA